MHTKYAMKMRKNEKRKSQRLKIPLKIHYKWIAKKGVMQEIFTQDISGGGMRVNSDKPFKKGQRLKSLLYFPHQSKPIKVINEVMWCKLKRKGSYDVGVKHIKIAAADKERFVFLFCETMLNFFLFAQNK